MCKSTSISKTSLFRISCLSQANYLDFLLIHSRIVTVHLPVEAQCPPTSMALHRTAVFSALKVDGHWIMLRLCPSRSVIPKFCPILSKLGKYDLQTMLDKMYPTDFSNSKPFGRNSQSNLSSSATNRSVSVAMVTN